MGIVADGLSCHMAHYNLTSCKYAHQIKLKTTTSYGSATLNEKGMVPKDKGWGCQTLVYGGKTHVFPPFLVSSNLVNLFNASAGG